MKYKIETEIDPVKWTPEVLVAMRKGAIEAKNQLLAKQETDKLLNRLNIKSHRPQHQDNNPEPDHGHRANQHPSNQTK